jgi:Icc-related predicted phosphoesterase
MKLLCFSDLHRDQQAAQRLVAAAESVDVVIGAGDFANRRQGLYDTLSILADITCPAILVPGNGETAEELIVAAKSWKSACVLHGSGCECLGQSFWGLGGGVPVTPFGDWSFDLDEQQASLLLVDVPIDAILVVHSPPLGTVDHDSSGRIHGSSAIRQTVIEKHPRLVVCGHIHSDWGKQVTLGSTKIVNAGPAGIVIELP